MLPLVPMLPLALALPLVPALPLALALPLVPVQALVSVVVVVAEAGQREAARREM
jgi:hypothetical protein